MKEEALPQFVVRPGDAVSHPDGAAADLRVVILYQDLSTQARAVGTWDRVAASVGMDGISSLAWGTSDLKRPGVFPAAIRAAGEADVVLVSLWSDEMILPELTAWAEAWLPLRGKQSGALAALLSSSPGPGTKPSAVEEYLCGVARRASMDFIMGEHFLPDSPSARISPGWISDPAASGSNALRDAAGSRPPGHWGINE
jgi:hypothetical protein